MPESISYSDETPFALELLTTDFYKPEAIHTRKFEIATPSVTRSTFIFPEYQRTQKPLEHVSAAQIQEGLMEGLYCAIGYHVRETHLLSPEEFKGAMVDSLFFTINASFRRLLSPNTPAQLVYRIIEITEKRLVKKFHSVMTEVDGFMRGKVECLLPKA